VPVNKAKKESRKSAAIPAIHRLRGILKPKPDAKPLAEEMAQHKRTEKELEQVKV
jgi:hypothetical protein